MKTQHGLSRQGAHKQLIHALSENSVRTMQHIDALSQQVICLSTQVAALVSAFATGDGVVASHTCDPEHFDGDLGKYGLLQCRLVFQQRPLSFAT